MNKKIKLNIKQIFDLALQNQNKKKFDIEKKLYEKVIEIDPNILNAQYNLGVVYDELDEVEKAIKCYEKVINLNPMFVYSYNNLGAIYSNLGNYKEAINYFILALEKDFKYKTALENLIYSLDHYSPRNKHPIIDANNNFRKLSHNLILENLLNNNNLELFFKKVYKIKSKIKNDIKFLEFSTSQAYRRNSFDLNCERHHDIYNKLNIIPKFCFSCYKIQIEPINVVELIKLFFIFDNLELSNNNWRKCMIELRDTVTGVYKGLIYCTGLEEAKKILINITPILKKYLKYKVSIKRGCSEFYKSFPNFNVIEDKDENFMKYENKWEKLELEGDSNRITKKKKISQFNFWAISFRCTNN